MFTYRCRKLASRLGIKSSRFIIWWITAFFVLFNFDVIYCTIISTLIPLTSYKSTYVTIIFGATFISAPSVFTRRAWIQALVLIIVALWLEANLIYARTYFYVIPLESYALVWNLKQFISSVTDTIKWYDCIIFLIIAIVWVLMAKKIKVSESGISPVVYLLLLIITVFAFYYPFKKHGGIINLVNEMSVNAQIAAFTPVTYGLWACIIADYENMREPLSPEVIHNVNEWTKIHREIINGNGPSNNIPDFLYCKRNPQNLFVIFCESLESWPIGLEIEGHEITPFFNSLVGDSSVYYNPNVLTQVKDGRSIDAQLLILAGQLPIKRGAFSSKYSGRHYEAIPALMSKAGASTYLLTADYEHTWFQGAVAQSFGVDTVVSCSDWDVLSPYAINPIGFLNDGELVNQSIDKMKSGAIWPEGDCAYVQMVTLSGHSPFQLNQELDSLNLKGQYPQVLKDYLTVVNYTDRSIEKLINYLKNRSDFNETIIVITGDHEGLASYREGLCKDGRYSWVNPLQHTPLFIINSTYVGIDDRTIGQVDIYSALLEMMGLETRDGWKGMGISPFCCSHPGIAVGSHGNVEGQEASDNYAITKHITDSYEISDAMIRHGIGVNKNDEMR